MSSLASQAEHEPGNQSGDADQHREGIVIEIAGLQLHDVLGNVKHAGGYAVRAEAVDDVTVADLPQESPDPLRGPNEDQIVQFIEIPLVEQELIKQRVLLGEFDRQIRPANIEQPGDQEPQRHHHRRQERDALGNVVHLVDDMRVHLEGVAEEFLHAVAREQLLERKTRQQRSGGKNADGNEHPKRRLVGCFVVLLIVRLAVEGLEDQPPRIERGQARRDHGQQETVKREWIVRGVSRFDDGVL